MSGTNFRNRILIILLVSFLFRFGFFLFGDKLPVMWDARRYVSAAIGLVSYVDSSGDIPFENERDDRYRFKHYLDKYIQGEQIEWLSYTPFTLTEARNEIFIAGPMYPAIIGTIIYFAPASDFDIIRIFNIILDVLANLLLMLIGLRLIGKNASLIAGFIYALYFPFALMTTFILLDASTTFLMLLAIYLFLRAYENDKTGFYLMSGFVSALLLLNKPTAMLLFIPFVIAYFVMAQEKLTPKTILAKIFLYLVPFLIITSLWASVASAKYGQIALRDPSYSEANLRQSSNITYEGYDLDKVESDFWTYSISEHIMSDISGYTGLLVKKFERLWSKPANEFKKGFIIPSEGWNHIHLTILLFGVLGMSILMFQIPRKGLWILIIPLYYTGIHVIFHSVSRYNFNAMPMIILSCGFFLSILFDKLNDKKVKGSIILSLLLLLFLYVADFKQVLQIVQFQLSELKIAFVIVIFTVLFFFILRKLLKSMLGFQSGNRPALIAGLVSIIVIMFSYSQTFSRNNWAEFICRLENDSVKAGTRIYISDVPEIQEGEIIAAVLDLNSGPGRKNSFNVTVGTIFKSPFIGGKPPLSDLFYPKPTYQFFSHFEPLGLEEFRQYAIIPLDPNLVRKDISLKGYTDISVSINNEFEEENNYINLYGNFKTSEDESYIPAVRYTSIERHVHRNDPRIRYPVKFLSDSTISYYIGIGETDILKSTDLSPSLGKQSGRYNIFLIHFYKNGNFDVY